MRWIILTFVLLVGMLFAAALQFLPWWGVVLLFLGIYLVGRYASKFVLMSIFSIPFKMKGKVMRRAKVEVHSVEPATAPVDSREEFDEAEDEEVPAEAKSPLDYYSIDATITPVFSPGGFPLWEPSEMLLMPANRKPRFRENEPDDWQVSRVTIFRDGKFGPDEEGKYFGPLRLRMLFGLPANAPRQLKFRYYFESFGEVQLPSSAPSGA